MADLDDFFAKKDRKKSKTTKKFTTTEEVAKKLEDSAKKTEKSTKKERIQEGDEGGLTAHEQDEWKEFEEEKKDYTGLKIGQLSINPNAEGGTTNTENSSEQLQTYDDMGNEIEKKAGPWKRMQNEATFEKEVPEPKQEPPTTISDSQAPSTYVPPSLRNQPPQQALQPSRLRSRAAPDIHNKEYFPTLSGGKPSEPRRNRNEGSFEMVAPNKSTSYRHAEQTKVASGQGPKLNLDNRYHTLSNDS